MTLLVTQEDENYHHNFPGDEDYHRDFPEDADYHFPDFHFPEHRDCHFLEDDDFPFPEYENYRPPSPLRLQDIVPPLRVMSMNSSFPALFAGLHVDLSSFQRSHCGASESRLCVNWRPWSGRSGWCL